MHLYLNDRKCDDTGSPAGAHANCVSRITDLSEAQSISVSRSLFTDAITNAYHCTNAPHLLPLTPQTQRSTFSAHTARSVLPALRLNSLDLKRPE